MFLPILLLRDYGVGGWIAFAVPNIVGAGAMGWVLRTPEQAWNLTLRHQAAMRWFSVVTIAFHLYVVFWLFDSIWPALLCVLPWVVMGAGARAKLGAAVPWVAVGVAVLSWGAFSYGGQLPGAWLDVGTNVVASRLPASSLWWLIPGLAVGFALCPYLDPTFQRARYSTGPGTGKAAFTVGFGVVFGSMIVFSLMYAGLLRPWVAGVDDPAITPPWRAILALHIGLQVGFTLLVHGREAFPPPPPPPEATTTTIEALVHRTCVPAPRPRGIVYPLGISALLLATLLWGLLARVQPTGGAHGITWGEIGYRCFLLMYGVVFPAYVLICMLPTFRQSRGRPGPCRHRRLAVFWVAATAAYPLAYEGFVAGPAWWLGGLYAVLTLAWVVVQVLPTEPR